MFEWCPGVCKNYVLLMCFSGAFPTLFFPRFLRERPQINTGAQDGSPAKQKRSFDAMFETIRTFPGEHIEDI